MKFSWSMRPNIERTLYDGVSSALAVAFVHIFLAYSGQESSLFPLILSPILIFLFNLIFGIFTKFRMASGLFKFGLISLSCLCTGIALFVFGQSLPSIILTMTFCALLMGLPRIFLGLNRKSEIKMIKTALQRRGPVLIVGGAGYIGSHVVDVLLKANHRVRILDKIMYNKETIADFLSHPNFELVEGDATDITKLVTAMDGVSTVVHLAGLVGDPACAVDEQFTRHTNVITTRMVKEVALSSGVERFIFASSCSVYGASDEIVDETSNLNPVSLYAITKIDSEKELLNSANDEFHPTVLRFATVFGHSRRPRFDLVGNLFSAQAFVDGRLNVIGPNQWRPFVHCRDLAMAIELVARSPLNKIHNQIFNVGDDRLNMTIGELAKKVANVAQLKGKKVELVINDEVTDRRNYRVSFEKIKSVLGFTSQVDVEMGVTEILENFEKGLYRNYRDQSYSNVEVTKTAVNHFHDPLQTGHLYRPVSDVVPVRVGS